MHYFMPLRAITGLAPIALFALLNILPASTWGQSGWIRGRVFDEKTGEALIGVSVFLPGTTSGAATDLDGAFALSVPAGTHKVQFSFISYNPITLTGIVVGPGATVALPDVFLQDVSTEIGVAEVSVEAARSSETAMMTMKRRSAALIDGVSAASIRLSGDGNAVEAAKRITGVSIEDGKYIFVRGLGDRYTKIMLNQVDIPGLDPDRNTLQMDIFPTALIDNISVSKNFTAEQPADFSGGLVQVELKDFPTERVRTVSFATTYNPAMHLRPEALDATPGGLDWLGMDDGGRALPAAALGANIPTPISGATQDEVNAFVRSFNPELGAQQRMATPDFSLGATFGDQRPRTRRPGQLGHILSLSYKQESKFYDEVTYGEYQRFIDPSLTQMRYATLQEGQLSERQNMWGGLAGLAFKSQTSKVRFTLLHLQSGERRAGQFDIDNDGEAVGQSGYIAFSENLEYNQRSLTNLLFQGTHLRPESGWEIDWRVSPTYSSSDDPDIRRTAISINPETGLANFQAGAGGNPSRIWRSLREFNVTSRMDLTRRFTWRDEPAVFRAGALHTFKARQYEILFFDIQFFGTQTWTPGFTANDVLKPENIYPAEVNNIYYQSGNLDPNPNAYLSNASIAAAYASQELTLGRLRTIAGLRAEHFTQRHTGRDQRYASGDLVNGNALDNERVLQSLDLFPSLNLIYAVNEASNLRAYYGRTIARPSFKELSFAQIIDPITNRIFNGSLFTYPGWEGSLTETRVQHADLRWEVFGKNNQLLSVSAFWKQFADPIELVRIPEQQTSTEFQPRNVGNGNLVGAELELRQSLIRIHSRLENWTATANLTWVASRIEMTDLEYESRLTYLKEGQTPSRNRTMAGQSPYVINVGMQYRSPEEGRIATGLFYNVKGPTLYIVGAGLFPDVYLEPFHSLNFSFAYKLGADGATTLDFRAANLLGDDVEALYQSFEAQPEVFSRLSPGRAFSIGVSHNF
jgi:hypothetical protein